MAERPDEIAPPLHHVGYVVPALRGGVERFAAATGAGPFFAIEHMVFDEVTFLDAPAVYDHSSAFGAWGPVLVELTEVHAASPPPFAQRLTAPGTGLGHVAWLADSLPDEIDRLAAHRITPFHRGRTGPVSAVWFNGGSLFGHPVEVLRRCDELLGFYAMVRAAAHGWDGTEPFRRAPAPSS